MVGLIDTSLRVAKAERQAALEQRLRVGERPIGRKIALTARAAQDRVGASGPIWGWLTDTMEIPSGGVFVIPPFLRTRAEVELVFVLGQDLVGPGVTSRHVIAATAAVCAGIELPTSPASGSPTTVAELVANNAWAGGFVIGQPRANWVALDLALFGALLEIDGQVVTSGAGAAVLGHPARAIAQLANDLAEDDGSELRAGELIFTGGLTEPVTLTPGMTVEASIAHLGHIGLRVR